MTCFEVAAFIHLVVLMAGPWLATSWLEHSGYNYFFKHQIPGTRGSLFSGCPGIASGELEDIYAWSLVVSLSS